MSIVAKRMTGSKVTCPADPLGSPPGPPLQEPITACVARTFEDRRLDSKEWDGAVASLGGSVYMTWDWLRTWWEFYGKGRELRLIVCMVGEEIVGLIPVYIDNLGLWPLRLRVARLVGANIPPKVFDPPVARKWAGACFAQVVQQLICTDGCDLVSLGPVSSTSEVWQSLPSEITQSGVPVSVQCASSEVHTLFRLPESQGEYLKSLSKNEQKNRRKYELRALRRMHAVRVEMISGPVESLLEEFDRFAPLHAAQWQAEGRSGHFGAWPDGLAYNRALVQALGALDRVRFLCVVADGITVSSQYIFSFAGHWYWELPARLPGPEWDRFSLGPSGIVTMIGEAITRGVHCIQAGLGHYDYKLRLRAEEHPALTFRIYPSRLASGLRKAFFQCLRCGLLICYHKIWYRRVMPRLPARFRSPQWGLWLRYDF